MVVKYIRYDDVDWIHVRDDRVKFGELGSKPSSS